MVKTFIISSDRIHKINENGFYVAIYTLSCPDNVEKRQVFLIHKHYVRDLPVDNYKEILIKTTGGKYKVIDFINYSGRGIQEESSVDIELTGEQLISHYRSYKDCNSVEEVDKRESYELEILVKQVLEHYAPNSRGGV